MEHTSPSGCQSSGGAMGRWNAQCPGQESIKLGQSTEKSFQQQSHVFSLVPNSPAEALRCNGKCSFCGWTQVEMNFKCTSDQCPLCPNSFRNLTGEKKPKHIPPCLNEWRLFPDISDLLTLSLQAEHSINFILFGVISAEFLHVSITQRIVSALLTTSLH